MQQLSYTAYYGTQIQAVVQQLGELRIAVFAEYPYLYQGNLNYELDYLRTYINAPKAMVLCVHNGHQLVGATTCIPLACETDYVKAPFVAATLNIDPIFYFGESILLPQYRGKGIGNRFFDTREEHAASFGSYTSTCFCAVQRPAGHALQPQGYQPHDAFWSKRGYQKQPHLQSVFHWQDIDQTTETPKTMVYWSRNI
jgi:GNAT superfamily N-acetyltransferase